MLRGRGDRANFPCGTVTPASTGYSAQRETQTVGVDAATELRHMAVPPGNRLEALKGERKGQHSIRVNDQWRVCFRWNEGNASEVEIVDYH